jgi:hypothetical protein
MYLTFHHFILNLFILLALGPDSSNIIEGQRITLYTAVGPPFTAKMAVVNLDTPYFKGHATVGLVANLAADALFSISSFCLLLDLVTSYVLDFPKISIPNRASAAKFATNPTVACPLKYGVSKLTTAIFAVNNVDESKDVKFAFNYENNVLKRKWESKDGLGRNAAICTVCL